MPVGNEEMSLEKISKNQDLKRIMEQMVAALVSYINGSRLAIYVAVLEEDVLK